MDRKTKPFFDIEKSLKLKKVSFAFGKKAVAAALSMASDSGFTRPGTSKNAYEAHWIGNVVIEYFPGIT